MIVYTSRTGNIRHIVSNLELPSCELTNKLITNYPYFLFIYTDGLGDIPKHVTEFLSIVENQLNIKGVIVSGNTNFGETFCKPAEIISDRFNISIIRKIDLRGNDEDLFEIRKQYEKIIEVNDSK